MSKIKPTKIKIEASSVCQLKCPSCPTASGKTRPTLGWGFLTLEHFQQVVDENPWVSHVELSNYGEILLNPNLLEILEYAYRRGVTLSARNGVNLNNVKAEVLDGLAKYRLRHMTCSIDGASQSTYIQYRVGGNFDRVIENIRTLNTFKQIHRTRYPHLRWQFVVFGHNEHEIPLARAMADELGMEFKPKLNWDPLKSPIRNEEYVRRELGVASRDEFRQTHGRDYASLSCTSLWTSPQINWDGQVLGCARNFWGTFGGNVFEDGVDAGINSEGIQYARDMLQGRRAARDDIPCSTCDIYTDMRENGRWLVAPVQRTLAGRARYALKSTGVPRALRGLTNRA
ncbi:MAG: radical SAM protein, partial [Rhodothermales bacterium]|nr:radical SAM protein [Rhodothermales bacterium]